MSFHPIESSSRAAGLGTHNAEAVVDVAFGAQAPDAVLDARLRFNRANCAEDPARFATTLIFDVGDPRPAKAVAPVHGNTRSDNRRTYRSRSSGGPTRRAHRTRGNRCYGV